MSPQKMSVGHIPQNIEVRYTPVPPKSQSQLLLCPQTLPGDGNAMSRTQVKMGGVTPGKGQKRGELTLQRSKKGRQQYMVTSHPLKTSQGCVPPSELL